MTLPQYPRVSFRAGDITNALVVRTAPEPEHGVTERGISQTAGRDLERYYALLARSLPTFTEPEASLLVDALNGLILEPHSGHLLWANIDDALRDGLAEKWGVDGPALVERLRKLPPFAQFAVWEAAERWWNGPYREEDRAASLRSVGLVK